MRFAALLVAVGALALGTALWLSTSGMFPVRVGIAGVAVERGAQVSRVLWCDLEKVKLDRGNLIVTSRHQTLSVPLGAHPKAVGLIVAEAQQRVPSVVDVPEAERKKLAVVTDKHGETVTIDDFQVAGHRCAASNTLISFERDARLCPNCGQVYHREHVPKKCATCGAELTDRVLLV